MKKAALILGFIFTSGALAVFFLLKQLGPNEAAALVPRTTILFLNCPDLACTSQEWKASALKQLILEEKMALLAQRSLGHAASWSHLFEAPCSAETLENFIISLKPGRFFIAAEPSNKGVAWVIGGQFFGTKKDLEKGKRSLHEALTSHYGREEESVMLPQGELSKKLLQRTYGTTTFSFSSYGSWSFISNSQEALLTTLSLASRHSPPSESLAGTAAYQESMLPLPLKKDFSAFLLWPSALEKIPFLETELSSLFVFIKELFPLPPNKMTPADLLEGTQALALTLSFLPQGMEEHLFLNSLSSDPSLENNQKPSYGSSKNSFVTTTILNPKSLSAPFSNVEDFSLIESLRPITITEKSFSQGRLISSQGPLTITSLAFLKELFRRYSKN